MGDFINRQRTSVAEYPKTRIDVHGCPISLAFLEGKMSIIILTQTHRCTNTPTPAHCELEATQLLEVSPEDSTKLTLPQ